MNIRILYCNNKEVKYENVAYIYFDNTFGRLRIIFKNSDTVWKSMDDVICINVSD